MALLPLTATASVVINETNFPDPAFREFVMSEEIDIDQDRQLDDYEIVSVTRMRVPRKGIKSLKGIEYFTELTWLSCYGNELTTLDLSKNTKLTKVFCHHNKLTSIDVTRCPDILNLDCSVNELQSIDVSNNRNLERLNLYINQLTSLDVTKCTALKRLYFGGNQIATTVDVSKNVLLDSLNCEKNQLTSLDVTKCKELGKLSCWGNKLKTLDVTQCTKLDTLYCDQNQLQALDLSKNASLTELYCSGNQLTSLDLTKHKVLTIMYGQRNQLTSLLFAKDGVMKGISCHRNRISGKAMDDMIASLPNQEDGYVYLFNTDYITEEHNVCTTKQVAAAKTKGWTAYHSLNEEWVPYPGSDETGLDAVMSEPGGTVDAAYGLDGRKLRQTGKGLNIIRMDNGQTRKVIVR